MSAFASRSFRLSSRLAARLATAVTSFRCSASNGVLPVGPSSTTQPALRSRLGAAPPNHSGAHSTARTLPSPVSTRGARKAPGARSARSATAGSIDHGASPSVARAATITTPSGSPSKSATAPRLAGTASSTWPRSVDEQLFRGGHRDHGGGGARQDAQDPALAHERVRLHERAGRELGHVAQPRVLRGRVGGLLGDAIHERPVGDLDHVAVAQQRVALHARAVQAGAVEAAQVAQHPAVARAHELGVPARQQHVGQDQLAVARAPDDHALALEREPLSRPVRRRESQVGHRSSVLRPTRRSRSPRRGGSSHPTACRGRGRRRPR